MADKTERARQEERVAANTDREIWRKGDGDGNGMSYYEPSIHVTEHGAIGINVGGTVYVKSVEKWHALAAELDAAERIIRDALPSLGANRRSYAQRALERGCAMLGENPDAWRGGGEMALEQEWRERVVALEKRNGELEAFVRDVRPLLGIGYSNSLGGRADTLLAASGAGEETT